MKKLILICSIALFSLNGTAQGEPPSAGLQNIAPPNSPAFVLMDVTPSNIIVPENVQAFSIQTLNAFAGNSNNGLANNNYAVEFQPYWYVKREDMNFFKYKNLTTNEPNGVATTPSDYTGYNMFGDIWKKASFSLALMNGDFQVFEQPQSYISVGGRTRLLTVRTAKQIQGYKSQYNKYTQFMATDEVINIMVNTSLATLEEKNEAIINLPGYKIITEDFDKMVGAKPLFALDMAVAYSYFLGDEDTGFDDAFGRLGVWFSGDLALNTPTVSEDSYVHFYGIFRFLRDGINLDENTNTLFLENKLDYGGKLELELNRVSFAYEYITRDSENNNESRSIGSIRYMINNAFAISGGFGENFKSEGNSVALFGIQWGLDNNSSVKLSPN